MIIIETNIPDITEENIDQAKMELSDNIIKNIFPLFDEIYNAKNDMVLELTDKISDNYRQLRENKKQIEETIKEYKRQQKVSKLLSRIDKLVSAGMVYDGNMKHETVILLKILPKLSENQINDHLDRLLKTIRKRFYK